SGVERSSSQVDICLPFQSLLPACVAPSTMYSIRSPRPIRREKRAGCGRAFLHSEPPALPALIPVRPLPSRYSGVVRNPLPLVQGCPFLLLFVVAEHQGPLVG